MPEKLHKVILDTNLWVSFLLDRQRSLLAQVLLSGTIDIISSQALEDELFEVLSRPKFQHRFSDESLAFIPEPPPALLSVHFRTFAAWTQSKNSRLPPSTSRPTNSNASKQSSPKPSPKVTRWTGTASAAPSAKP